ncbi:hypothetical protein [Paracoccus sp. AS002]|uniref:hypothetical protein n=1 Tax=Paracoccus sp. AS002 TaxID=3019545 RepID=UPI0023E862D6|nr:hypothetical protein [Paracoccus sp. AS002]MDF3905533.1 hypothetical protein [Paracoccus sp. AS002]
MPDTSAATLTIQPNSDHLLVTARPRIDGPAVTFVAPVDPDRRSAFETAAVTAFESVAEMIASQTVHPARQSEQANIRLNAIYKASIDEITEIQRARQAQLDWFDARTAPEKTVHPAEGTIVNQFAAMSAGQRAMWIERANIAELSAVLRWPTLFQTDEQYNAARLAMFYKRGEKDPENIVKAGVQPTVDHPAKNGVDQDKLKAAVHQSHEDYLTRLSVLDDREAVVSNAIKTAAVLVELPPESVFDIIRVLK